MSPHLLTLTLTTRMLDVVSDADTAPVPADATAPEIKVQPEEAMFRAVPPKDTEKGISGADRPPQPPDTAAPEIKVQPADAILGRMPLKDLEKASARQGPSVFMRLLRFTARTVVVVCLCGLAWAAGAYYSRGPSLLNLVKSGRAPELQQSQQRDDMASEVRQMAEEMRALKASINERGVAQDARQKNQLNSVQTPTGATIAHLMSRVDKLDTDFAAKLSRVNEQLTSIEQQISASHATLTSRARPPRKRAKHLHDAFDPSQEPNAPGVPRSLGAR